MADLAQVIKKAAVEAVKASYPVEVVYGSVVTTDPLSVKISQQLTVEKSFLNLSDGIRTSIAAGKVVPGDRVILIKHQGGQRFTAIDVFHGDEWTPEPFIETDPTVPAWAKEPVKPPYTAEEVGALPDSTKIPAKLSDLTNDIGAITKESDPTVPSWAKTPSKPVYTANEVGAVATGESVDINQLDGGVMIRSLGNGNLPAWRFHANGETAWIHHWDADGNIGMPLQLNPDNSVSIPNLTLFKNDSSALTINNGVEASVNYSVNGQDAWVVGENCAGLKNCFVFYNASHGGIRAYIDRDANLVAGGRIQAGNGYLLPAGASETADIVFQRPSDYEYEAHMDLIRNSIRIYAYDKSGTSTCPVTIRLNDAAFISAGRVYALGGSFGTVLNKQNLSICTGEAAVHYEANKQINVPITFPSGLFSAAPVISIMNYSGIPADFTRVPTATSITASGATLCLLRNTSDPTTVKWMAAGT